MTMNTNEFSGLLRPDEINTMLFEPIEQLSIAGLATTYVYTQSKTYRVPMFSEDPQANWTPEGEEIEITEPKAAEASTTPRKLAGLTTATTELLEDSAGDTAAAVGAGLARDISAKIDQALFAPTTPEHGPAGLGTLDTTDIEAGPDWTDADPFTEAVYTAENNGATVTGWFTNPADALELSTLKEGEGSARNLLTPDVTAAGARLVEGVPMHVSTAVPAGEVWGIDNTQVLTVVRQDATIVADRSAFFTSDRVAIRATMRVGFIAINPTGIIKITRGE